MPLCFEVKHNVAGRKFGHQGGSHRHRIGSGQLQSFGSPPFKHAAVTPVVERVRNGSHERANILFMSVRPYPLPPHPSPLPLSPLPLSPLTVSMHTSIHTASSQVCFVSFFPRPGPQPDIVVQEPHDAKSPEVVHDGQLKWSEGSVKREESDCIFCFDDPLQALSL